MKRRRIAYVYVCVAVDLGAFLSVSGLFSNLFIYIYILWQATEARVCAVWLFIYAGGLGVII